MYIYPKRTIFSNLTPIQIFSLIENSGQFIVKIEKERFTVRERVYISSSVLFPVITGVVTACDDGTTINISFKLSKIDIVGYGTYFFIVFILSLLLGFLGADIMLTITLICFGLACCAVVLMFYTINCRRAFKKIIRLIESVN